MDEKQAERQQSSVLQARLKLTKDFQTDECHLKDFEVLERATC